MNNFSDFILIVFAAFMVSTVVTLTRGDKKNRGITIIVLTILGTIFLTILRLT